MRCICNASPLFLGCLVGQTKFIISISKNHERLARDRGSKVARLVAGDFHSFCLPSGNQQSTHDMDLIRLILVELAGMSFARILFRSELTIMPDVITLSH